MASEWEPVRVEEGAGVSSMSSNRLRFRAIVVSGFLLQ
jgi:hypothetical protein